MSVKRFAMLSAITYHNQQTYNNHNNTNYNINNNNNSQTTTRTINTPESTTTEIVNSNKSTLIQLKQKQQQSKQIIAPLFLENTTTPTTTTAATRSSALTHFSNSDKNAITTIPIITRKNDQHIKSVESDDTAAVSDPSGEDSSNDSSSESSKVLDSNKKLKPERQPPNTYTSTTYYGSGFGVFHQQNMRSNGGGGGIALITGSSNSNGMGSGSYSNGINNNVNLLLGGAMLTLITTILCVVCYCCHRNIKKRTEAAYRQQRQWLESDPNMEIYSVEQCYETSGLFVGDSMDGLATIPALHHEPPPSYDAVVAMQEQQQLLMQQHHQQQLIMQQQQLLQQQLSTNNSPPPGYRSSLDVNAMIQSSSSRVTGLGGGGVLAAGGSVFSDMDTSSLASSAANIRTSSSISPIDTLPNHNDVNGNMALALAVPMSNTTPTNSRTTPSYLRNKQPQQQQQRNVAATQISQLNMKKVLQAQSCCSLQRAEVENMWNAAAAALAARSAHLPNDSRASTSSPTLALNFRKPSPVCKNSNSNTPETFGSRYLKQNYYRRGCPLCGKFRYDNDSALSTSMESNLDALAGSSSANEMAATGQNNLNNNESLGDILDNQHMHPLEVEDCEEVKGDDDDDDENVLDEEMLSNDNDQIEQQCSCLESKRKNDVNLKHQNSYQNLNTCQNVRQEIEEATAVPDNNANDAFETERQSAHKAASNNNNNNNDITNMEDLMNLPSTSAAAASTISQTSAGNADSTSLLTESLSTPSVTINLDCINENGIISLDMSKIIDKTGLPTYDAALKLESSGYV